MCGRYAITLPPAALRRAFRYADIPNFPARPEVRPTEPVPIVRLERGERRFRLVRWGFIPAFVRDEREFPLLINARAESAFEKPSFRNAIRRRRCLFPADGFYEWQALDARRRQRRPFLVRRPGGGPIAMAGIWESWQSPNGSEIETAAILTLPANATLAAIHERMPLVLDEADFDAWLAPETEPRAVAALLRPPAEDGLELIPLARVPADFAA